MVDSELNFMDIFPGAYVYIHNIVKKVARVEETYISTRESYDHLCHWGFGDDNITGIPISVNMLKCFGWIGDDEYMVSSCKKLGYYPKSDKFISLSDSLNKKSFELTDIKYIHELQFAFYKHSLGKFLQMDFKNDLYEQYFS